MIAPSIKYWQHEEFGGQYHRGWFEINLDQHNVNDEQFEKASQIIQALVHREAKVFGYDHIFLGGWSGGGVIALYVATIALK